MPIFSKTSKIIEGPIDSIQILIILKHLLFIFFSYFHRAFPTDLPNHLISLFLGIFLVSDDLIVLLFPSKLALFYNIILLVNMSLLLSMNIKRHLLRKACSSSHVNFWVGNTVVYASSNSYYDKAILVSSCITFMPVCKVKCSIFYCL